MLSQFKTYQLAIQFHHACREATVPQYLRDQVLRASSSVALNIAEGSAKLSPANRKRYYAIALGSLREFMTALDLAGAVPPSLASTADQLGACLYRLCHPK
jgi:four helix bundle protein